MSTPPGGLPYPWVEPSSVKAEGKYRVTADGHIKLIHVAGRLEHALVSDEHPDLVQLVQGVKRAHGDEPSGVFYLNEWQHVLVKAGGGTWYAGTYPKVLDFYLDGERISARAPTELTAGQRWTGPQVGIRYTINGRSDDVYCRRKVGRHTEKLELLSEYIDDAAAFVRSFAKYKPFGGRLYINEARELFSPVADDPGAFVYLGTAPWHQWFPEPQVD